MEPEGVVVAEGGEPLGSPVLKKCSPVTMDSYMVPVVFDRDAQRHKLTQQSEVEEKGK